MKQRIPMVVFAVTSLLGMACGGGSSPEPKAAETRSAELSAERTKGAAVTGKEKEMKSARGFVGDIETMTTENQDFRRVLYTAKHVQLVAMSIPPGQDIGAEVHEVDQFFRIEAGVGEVVIGESRAPIGPGSAIVIPAGTRHDIVNRGATPLKLYSLYAPPQHRDGVVHHTRAAAETDDEHFDGKTTR